MGVNSLPKTVTRQRCDCDLNPGPSAPESSTLSTQLPSHPPFSFERLCRHLWGFDMNSVDAMSCEGRYQMSD